jgi:hypothetical protein
VKLKMNPGSYAEYEIEGTPAEIAELLRALGKEPPAVFQWGPVSVPTVWTFPDVCPLDGAAHRYPAVWNGLNPPPCEKCGQAPPNLIATWTYTEVVTNPAMPLPTTTQTIVGLPFAPYLDP